jgi:hypothetical protein
MSNHWQMVQQIVGAVDLTGKNKRTKEPNVVNLTVNLAKSW